MKTIHILAVGNDAPTMDLVSQNLQQAGVSFVISRVDAKAKLVEALQRHPCDIVLFDNDLPGFPALDALKCAKEHRANLPFILMVNPRSETPTARAIGESVDDYVLKNHLPRLPWTIRNALQKFQAEREKTRAEAAMNLSKEQYRLIAENMRDLMCVLDLEGNFTYASPSFKASLGYSPEELLGYNSFSLVHADDKDTLIRSFREALANKQGQPMESRYRHRNGEWRWFESICSWIYDPKQMPKSAVIISRDITERKNLEEQFFQSQKMDAIGKLAGGIAHDFNNILTIIKGNVRFIKESLEEKHEASEFVEEIVKVAERATTLTRQLLAFSRRQTIQLKILSLNDLVLNMEKMLRHLIEEDIELLILPGEDVGSVKADAGQIEQVVLNLVVNARDAMPKGGNLTIETGQMVFSDDDARHHVDVKPGEYAYISVTDTGVGIPQEIQKRIFEPFFTTKEKDKGTGLGLATVFGIVKQHGGHLSVNSASGRGSTFHAFLPRVREKESMTHKDVQHAPLPRGKETVLVVEDDLSVRKVASEALKRLGYTVLVAKSAEDALMLMRKKKDVTIDLLLTDVIMPGMNGKQLVEKVLPMFPHMKVVYMSGYTDDNLGPRGIIDKELNFIEKPFSMETFARKVREALQP